MSIEVIAFDADDTLWHNEVFYGQGRDLFRDIHANIAGRGDVDQILSRIEIHNIRHYGYGIKSFVLSMIETAFELGGEELQPQQVGEILNYAKRVIHADLEIFPGVDETLQDLSEDFKLMLVTKGDLFEQELKIARSGLAKFFDLIEVISNKTVADYRRLLDKYGIDPSGFLMVGNSLRSDILPVVELGGKAIYIPYDGTWAHETVLERPLEKHEYYQLERIVQAPDFIRSLRSNS